MEEVAQLNVEESTEPPIGDLHPHLKNKDPDKEPHLGKEAGEGAELSHNHTEPISGEWAEQYKFAHTFDCTRVLKALDVDIK